MQIDYDIAMEVASHEAIVRQAYKDSVGKWTWSVGLTSATGHKVERYIGKPQSLEHCLRVYAWALDNYANEVRRAFEGFPLTKAQFAAALSFHWNTGKISSASWVRLFKEGKMKAARKAFMLYRKPPEIIERRRREAALLFDGVWHNNGVMTEWTRVKPSGHIDWSSGKKLNVERELRAALAGDIPASDKVIIETPKVPKGIEEQVNKKTGFWQWLTGLFGSGALGLGWIAGMDWEAIVAGGAVLVIMLIILLILRHRIIAAVKDIRGALDAGD